MTLSGKRTCAFLALLSLSLAAHDRATAADWPPPQMTVVIPHGVGGATDQLSRSFGQIWQQSLGTRFIYEDRDGASTRIGTDYFLRQPHDGSVLLAGNLSTSTIMYMQQKPRWKWEESIYPLGLFGVDPASIFVSKNSRFKSFAEVIEAAKVKPVTFAISQWQSEDTLLLFEIQDLTGAKFQMIPHDVSTQVMAQVLGGNIEVGILKQGNVQLGGDSVRVLALDMPKNLIPELTNNAPTVQETLGAPVISAYSYRAYSVHPEFARKYPDRIKKLKETFHKTLQDPRFIVAAKSQGISPKLLLDLTPEEIQEKIVKPVMDTYGHFGQAFNRKS